MKYKEILIPLPAECGPDKNYCVAFCYPVSGPVVVKGCHMLVTSYINYTLQLCHYNMVTYKQLQTKTGGYRKKVVSTWAVNRKTWDIKTQRNRTARSYRLVKGRVLIATFNRVPKRFIKEFELYDRANIIYKLAQEIQRSEGK